MSSSFALGLLYYDYVPSCLGREYIATCCAFHTYTHYLDGMLDAVRVGRNYFFLLYSVHFKHCEHSGSSRVDFCKACNPIKCNPITCNPITCKIMTIT